MDWDAPPESLLLRLLPRLRLPRQLLLLDSPCISSKNCLYKSQDDMFDLSCCHDKNACVPSNPCIGNNIEETQFSM